MKHVFVVNTRGMANDTEATIFIGSKPITCALINVDSSYRDVVELAKTLCGIDGMTANEITEVELSAMQVAKFVANRHGASENCDDEGLPLHDIDFIDYWTEAAVSDDLLSVMVDVGFVFETEQSQTKIDFEIANVEQGLPALKGMIAIEPDGIAISLEKCNGFDGVDSAKCAAFIEADSDDFHVRFYGNKGMENPSRIVRLDLAALRD
ncbi:hypothetical protein LMH73_010260 [Vibrio splendidus]|nr:hypothetical protein [Vibrio splendidus]MCC4883325.1 hypothetical protein [Vibrio splendidus]